MNTSTPSRRGLGITAGLDAGLARDLAVRCEQLGYHSLWSNDEPASPGLKTLVHFAGAAPQLELGVGVLPLDRHQPVRIAGEIARLGLDPAKLWIGVGSGQLRAPIHLVQRGVAELRELLPEGTRIVVAAMRPRMCQLGGAIADGVLLNWMLPAQAAQARRWVQQGADQAGRATPIVASYVRVAVGADSLHRLRDEERRYRKINEAHGQHFELLAGEARRLPGPAPIRPTPARQPPLLVRRQPGGDAQQPRGSRSRLGPVAASGPERGQEGVSHQVGHVLAGPATVDPNAMTVATWRRQNIAKASGSPAAVAASSS